ncbi:hypothetical protein [Euzebya sp.]|uniref:hypothetical protein n=1 Tax=Euzebya sp. TaxID=1971409 RepID=UPI0035157202
MTDRIDDLRTMVLEFRSSVSEELSTTNRRIDELADEIRTRLATSETAILNAIRDLVREMDRRFGEVDRRFVDVDHRFQDVDQRFDAIDQRLDGLDQRLDAMDLRFDGVDRRLDELRAEGG